MKRYECMFLFDNAVAYEWPSVEREVNRLCQRIGANLLACVKFDERKLAFEIRGRKRGTYVLTYFDAPAEKISDLERDVQLSESVLRVLVLRNDSVTPERLAELRAWQADKPLSPMASDRRDDRDHRGDRGDRDYRGDRGDRFEGRREHHDRDDRRDDRPPRREGEEGLETAEEGAHEG